MEAMHRLMQFKIPSGPVYHNVKTLAAEVRIVKIYLNAVGAEAEIFASCFTVATLVNKLDEMVLLLGPEAKAG